jgi:hypothetical protein
LQFIIATKNAIGQTNYGTYLTSSKSRGKTVLLGLIGGLALFEEGLRNLDLLQYSKKSGQQGGTWQKQCRKEHAKI